MAVAVPGGRGAGFDGGLSAIEPYGTGGEVLRGVEFALYSRQGSLR